MERGDIRPIDGKQLRHAVDIGRRFATPVAVLANGLLCHSEGLVCLPARRTLPPIEGADDFTRFMNLPEIARRNYEAICAQRLPGLRALSEESPLNRIEWNDRSLGVVVHGLTEAFLREVWHELPVKPSILSLGMTYPPPRTLIRKFAEGLNGRIMVIADGLRFIQEEMNAQGIAVEGKEEFDPRTEWSPEDVGRRLGVPARSSSSLPVAAVRRPPTICAGCSYRAFGLAVERLRKKKKIVGAFGDIGCNTLLYFLLAVDTCACMGMADTMRQGVVNVRPELAGRTISVIGDSTECHSGLDSTRNAVFRNIPGVKIVLDNRTTAMTGGQPAPSSPHNLAGETTRFYLDAALAGEGALVQVVDAFDLKKVESTLREALERAEKEKAFSVIVLRGPCMQEVPAAEKKPCLELVKERCSRCDLCLICPGIERDEEGYQRFTHLSTGCGGRLAICQQRCNLDALVPRSSSTARAALPPPAMALADETIPDPTRLPPALRVAIRGVGGQGNLFLGKVLAEVALRAGYQKIVKGETHGMAQLGGAVVSTFACGDVHSAVLAPGSVDVLVALEMSEVLRPGFLDLLKPGGLVLLNQTRIVPASIKEEEYPKPEQIRAALRSFRVLELDGLAEARAIGDTVGRTVNVIALGALSTVAPLSTIPLGLWQHAILDVTPSEIARRANLAAFERGRQAVAPERPAP
jgi:indolepyruvate ferredoxin oxidoreductase alpha subunit